MKENTNQINKKIHGYTAGVFDLFHIGHLNLLRRARSMCDYLTVGVSNDELVRYKFKTPVVAFKERLEIVKGIRYVDNAVEQFEIDKFKAWERIGFDVLFVGDDWKGTGTWKDYEIRLGEVGVKVIYLPYTKGTSSTLINSVLINLRNNQGGKEK